MERLIVGGRKRFRVEDLMLRQKAFKAFRVATAFL